MKRCANCEEVAKNVKFWLGKRAIKTSATNASKKILKHQNTYILKLRKKKYVKNPFGTFRVLIKLWMVCTQHCCHSDVYRVI